MARWERQLEAPTRRMPYALLVVSTALGLARPEAIAARATMLGLAAVAGLWVYLLLHRRGPLEWPEQSVRESVPQVVYVVGLLGRVRRPGEEPLSPRALEVLDLVAQGLTNREAAFWRGLLAVDRA